jgi:acetyl-CoA carboxylase biotin carboxylase subunit
MYQRILVANRGEIALRIIRACKELGVETVAIYSEGDRGARYLELADEAFCVGPAKASESYLKISSVISAAEVGNVQAIHPGYGFLAENAHFNEICRSCNIDFIGPTPEAMSRLGDKNKARDLARQTGVPVVPGSEGIVTSEEEALGFAHDVGFPVLIKAVAGGGGRGMRVASNDLALKSALQQARAEAEADPRAPAQNLRLELGSRRGPFRLNAARRLLSGGHSRTAGVVKRTSSAFMI